MKKPLEEMNKEYKERKFKNASSSEDILNTMQNTHSSSEIMKKPLEEMNKEYRACKIGSR